MLVDREAVDYVLRGYGGNGEESRLNFYFLGSRLVCSNSDCV